ncbi:MAG: hypothetical protein D6708_01850 [Candidatus Dadabacteria bacterium]|nr:MAG: hypothetical protein D6708_01850 [Candidatus Dadabacteria bacterium]
MGHPMNTAEPTIMRNPRPRRWAPAARTRGRNSRVARAAAALPRKNPRSSGRRYCIRGLGWRPRAPTAFSRKQEMQIPVLAGLPQ